MKKVDTLAVARALLDAASPDQADLEASISAIEQAATDAATRIEQLAGARQGLLISGSFEDLASHDRAVESTRFTHDQASAVVEQLKRKLEPVAEANRRAAIEAERDEIEKKMVIACEEMKKLPKLTTSIRNILGIVAAADLAAKEFADAHPDEPLIARAESRVRHEPEKRKVLREERVWAWASPSGKIDTLDHDPRSVQLDEREPANAPWKSLWIQRDRPNFLELFESGQMRPTKDHVFRTQYGTGVQVLPVQAIKRQVEVTYLYMPPSLASSFKMPPLRRGDPSWSLDNPDVFDVLAAIDRPITTVTRTELKVELVPLTPDARTSPA